MKNLNMKTLLSSSQKPNKLALQLIKVCKTFENFQLGSFYAFVRFSRHYNDTMINYYQQTFQNNFQR